MSAKILSEEEINISVGKILLKGNLVIPKKSKAIVLFAHGTGSSRLSPRNRFVAAELNRAGIATLLFDLLTEEEEQTAYTEYTFNIELLADRLIAATNWIKKNRETKNLSIGYFGASTGAAAALIATAKISGIKAVVSRGGRPDLAMRYLKNVKASTLLIVGSYDIPVIEMNEEAFKQIRAEKKLEIVPEAGHLFEEEGKLEEVAELATRWFLKYLK